MAVSADLFSFWRVLGQLIDGKQQVLHLSLQPAICQHSCALLLLSGVSLISWRMSLFGESPPNSPSVATEAQNKSLFGDEPAAKRDTTSSSLFEDNSNDNNSPWSIPTPKKSNRQNFVKNLLPVNQVPESYVDAYDNLLSAGQGHGAGVSLTAVRKVLQSSQISSSDQGLVLNIILPAGQDSASSLERGEFNVLLALIGLAQEEEDIGLDAVDDRRKRE